MVGFQKTDFFKQFFGNKIYIMAHWDNLKQLISELSSEKKDSLLISINDGTMIGFLKNKLRKEEHVDPIIHEGILRITQIQALIWFLEGKMWFGLVDPISGDFSRKQTKNGRDGILAPELTIHHGFWTLRESHHTWSHRLVNLEVVIDTEMREQHILKMKAMLML